MEGLQELTNAISNGTIPTPCGLPFLKIGGLQLSYTPVISGMGKATDFKFGGYIYGPIRMKAH